MTSKQTSQTRSTADMLAEIVALLTAHAKDQGYMVSDEPTDIGRAVMLARSIRFGWRP